MQFIRQVNPVTKKPQILTRNGRDFDIYLISDDDENELVWEDEQSALEVRDQVLKSVTFRDLQREYDAEDFLGSIDIAYVSDVATGYRVRLLFAFDPHTYSIPIIMTES